MKRIKLETSTNNHFIGSWQIKDAKLMDKMIDFFNENSDRHEIGVSGHGDVDKQAKESIDLTILPKELQNKEMEVFNKYFEKLQECYWDYIDQWSFLKGKWGEMYIGPFNIQKYNINGHFKKWHTERDSISSAHRALAWMTYLNNVDDGGNTDFKHFDLSIKPEKGKTLIWPAEWTHAHRGQIAKKNKYIITGWFHFPSIDK